MAEKRRRIRFHRRLSLALAIVLSVVIAFLILKRSPYLPYQLSKLINEHYFNDTPFRFNCRKVTGDFINRITIEHLVLEYNDGRRSFSIFRADAVEVDYQLVRLLSLKLIVDELILKNVRIQVGRDNKGNLILPIPAIAAGPKQETESPHAEVRRFMIDGLHLFFSGGERELRVRDVSLSGSFKYAAESGSLEIEDGSGYLIDSETSISSFRTRVDFKEQNVELKEFITRLDHSFVMATGGYTNGELRHLQFVFNPVDLKEVSEMGLIPPNEGKLGGNIVCGGRLDSLTVRGSLTGDGWGLAFGGVSFSGVLEENRLSLESVQGDVFGSYIDGRMVYELGEEGGFTFHGQCADLDVSQGFLPGEGTPETALNGELQLEYRKAGDTYTFEVNLDSSVVNGFESKRLEVKGSWQARHGIDLEQFVSSRPGFVLTGSGTIDNESRANLLFELEGDKLDYLWQYLDLPLIEGSLGINGRIMGPTDNMQINLNGEFHDAALYFASIDTGLVQAQINNAPSESSTVRIDIQGQKISLGGGVFSNPHVLLDATPGRIIVQDFSFSKGDTFVTMDFSIRQDSTGSQVDLKHVSIATQDEVWKTTQSVNIVTSGGTTRIDTLLLSSDQGSVGLMGSYSRESNKCSLTGWGERIDLSLFKDALGLPIRFQGRSRFHASVLGEIENPQVDLIISLSDGVIDSVSFDRLDLQGSFDERDGYELDKLVVVEGEDSLIAHGWWRFTKSPILLLREGFDKEEAFEKPITLNLSSRHFPIVTIFRLVHSDLRPSGTFSGGLVFENALTDPKIRITGVLSEAEKGGIHLPEVTCGIVYENNLLLIERIEFDDGTTNGKITGTIPIIFNVAEGIAPLKDAPVQLDCSIQSDDLSDLPLYLNRIATASGKFTFTIDMRGSIENPDLKGDLRFLDCSMRLAGMEEVYENINAQFVVRGDRIELKTLTGKEGKRGSFQGSGFIELDGLKLGKYQVDLYFNDFVLSSIPEFSSTQDGSISITSQARENGGLIPYITGSVNVKQAQILLLLGAETGGTAPGSVPTVSPSWLCNIDINAPKNVWVRNPELRMELGGDVILKRDEQGLYLRGELEVLRGSYILYNNKFRITDGRFDFSKTNTLRPEMFLNAYTPYRREGDREHRIYLSLAWPSDKREPQATLSYDEPGYSETDIWKMLGGTYVSPTAQSGSDTWDAAGTAQNIASNYLERMLNAQMANLTIEVETRAPQRGSFSADGDREMSIAIGKYLSEDLYLKYRQGLSISSAREVDIEYRISNLVIIRSEIIRHSEKLFLGQKRQASDEINLDVKFRFEY